MAYEEMTYERIMSRCLARVPGTVDKREGSIIYDAIARQQPNWRFFTRLCPPRWTGPSPIPQPMWT